MAHRFRSWLAAFAVTALLTACTQPVGAPPQVPQAQAETIPLPPISPVEIVWRPGHWTWDGSGYRWLAGEWIPRTTQTNLWRPGYWQQSPGGWVWQAPGWV